MRIKALSQFKDTENGRPVSFEPDDVCTVDAKDGIRWVAHGWAIDVSAAPAQAVESIPAPSSVDLDVQSGVLGSKSTNL